MNYKLINFRKEKCKSQLEMAKLLGVSLSLYEKVERGIRNPSYKFICKFKNVFYDTSVDSIFFEEKRHESCGKGCR